MSVNMLLVYAQPLWRFSPYLPFCLMYRCPSYRLRAVLARRFTVCDIRDSAGASVPNTRRMRYWGKWMLFGVSWLLLHGFLWNSSSDCVTLTSSAHRTYQISRALHVFRRCGCISESPSSGSTENVFIWLVVRMAIDVHRSCAYTGHFRT